MEREGAVLGHKFERVGWNLQRRREGGGKPAEKKDQMGGWVDLSVPTTSLTQRRPLRKKQMQMVQLGRLAPVRTSD